MDRRAGRAFAVVSLAVLLGCGRVGFDPLDRLDSSAGRDGSAAMEDARGIDARPTDGPVVRIDSPTSDGGPPPPCTPIAPTYVGFGSWPELGFSSGQLYLAYGDAGSIRAMMIPIGGSGGVKVTTIPGTMNASRPDVLAFGSDAAVSFEDARGTATEVWLDSSVIPAPIRVSGTGSQASRVALAVLPDRAIVVYKDDSSGNFEIYGRTVDPIPTFGPIVALTATAIDSQQPAVAATPEGALVAWQEHAADIQVWVRLLDAIGEPIGVPRQITGFTGSLYAPALAARGTDYALTFTHGPVPESIWFVPLDPTGAPMSAPAQISVTGTASLEPDITPFGAGFAVAWLELDGVGMTLVTSSGARVGTPWAFTAPAPGHVSVAATDSGVAIAFDAMVGGGQMVAYAHLCF